MTVARARLHGRGDETEPPPALGRGRRAHGGRRSQALPRRPFTHRNGFAHRLVHRRWYPSAGRRLLFARPASRAARGAEGDMRWTFASALVFFAAIPAGAQDPRREDFAYGIAVRPSVEAPLYRARLPLAIYRSITRPDLGDLRVFNAGGALVPPGLWR